jgi:hypothetical protein
VGTGYSERQWNDGIRLSPEEWVRLDGKELSPEGRDGKAGRAVGGDRVLRP